MTLRARGRGAASNPPNRFERLVLEPLDSEEPPPAVPTVYFDDATRSILSRNDSPDVPFNYSVNPYRGCEHGFFYCFGSRKRGEGEIAANVHSLFQLGCRKAGLSAEPAALSTEHFARGGTEQLRMF